MTFSSSDSTSVFAIFPGVHWRGSTVGGRLEVRVALASVATAPATN